MKAVGLKTNKNPGAFNTGAVRKTRRVSTMITIVRYLGRRRVTITIDKNGDVTVTVEPPPKRQELNNLLMFKHRNP